MFLSYFVNFGLRQLANNISLELSEVVTSHNG
jgi:hypothetical protein